MCHSIRLSAAGSQSTTVQYWSGTFNFAAGGSFGSAEVKSLKYHMFIALLILFILSTLVVDFIDEGR